MASETPRSLSVRELAAYLRVHPTTIYRLLKTGELTGLKRGNAWRVNLDYIDRWRLARAAEHTRKRTAPKGRG